MVHHVINKDRAVRCIIIKYTLPIQEARNEIRIAQFLEHLLGPNRIRCSNRQRLCYSQEPQYKVDFSIIPLPSEVVKMVIIRLTKGVILDDLQF